MGTGAVKHYKFINSKTGNVIYYHSLSITLTAEELKVELEKVKNRVATENSIFGGTIYWEEIKPDTK
ncbi:hypothetical protein GCM10027049_08510 [Mucilaginibacter puniceus]